MGIRLPGMIQAKEILRRSLAKSQFISGPDVPKGHFAIYVGESQTQFVIPVSYLKHPSFQDLLSRAEEEFGFDHQMGGLAIPCHEDTFITVTSHLLLSHEHYKGMKGLTFCSYSHGKPAGG